MSSSLLFAARLAVSLYVCVILCECVARPRASVLPSRQHADRPWQGPRRRQYLFLAAMCVLSRWLGGSQDDDSHMSLDLFTRNFQRSPHVFGPP